MERSTIFKFGKPSISKNHGELLVITRGYICNEWDLIGFHGDIDWDFFDQQHVICWYMLGKSTDLTINNGGFMGIIPSPNMK